MKDLSFLKKNIISHRGLHDNNKVPENSMVSFKRALRKKYIIELDVHLLKNNTVVVFHDANLKRMTGINGKIKNYTYDELKDIKLLNTKCNIPRLDEVLKMVNGKVPLIIEMKYDTKAGKLEKEVSKLLDNYKGLFAVKSFNPLSVSWFKKNRPDYIRGLLLDAKEDRFLKIKLADIVLYKMCKPNFLSCDYKLYNKKYVKKFRKNDLILAWTIDSKELLNQVKDCFDNYICENISEIF